MPISGTGTVTKSGAGTQALSGTHTYTGATTVSAGKLFINGSLSNTAVALTVNSGATLGGTGIEWVVGGDPTTGTDDAGLAPTIDLTTDPDGKMLFSFRRTTNAKNDANTIIAVQYGNDLAGWITAIHQGTGANQITITETPNGPGLEIVTVALPPGLADNGDLFVRLSVRTAL